MVVQQGPLQSVAVVVVEESVVIVRQAVRAHALSSPWGGATAVRRGDTRMSSGPRCL